MLLPTTYHPTYTWMKLAMLRPDFSKWNQNAEALLHEAIHAEHHRTRERCLALYMIGTGKTSAARWAKAIERQEETVQSWVHRYNEQGMKGIIYRHTGGRSPFLPKSRRGNLSRR